MNGRWGDERGQALVAAVLLLGVAAVAVIGLTEAQARIFGAAREQRAGEAAVAAAGAYVADRAFELQRSLGRAPTPPELAALVASADVIEGAQTAATEMARLHGAADPSDVQIRSFPHEIELDLVLGGRRHRALLDLLGALRDAR